MAFDLWAFVTSAVGLLILTIAVAAIGFGFVKVRWSDRTLGNLRIVSVLLFLGFLVTAGAFSGLTGSLSTGTAAGQAQFSILASANGTQSWVTIDNTEHVITVQLNYNSTSGALTNYQANIDFSITRSDTGSQDAIATADLSSVGQVGNASGTGTTYPVLGKNADGTYKINWTHADTGAVNNKAATILVAGGGSAILTANVTANSDAAANMALYDQSPVKITVGGQLWTFNFLLANIDT